MQFENSIQRFVSSTLDFWGFVLTRENPPPPPYERGSPRPPSITSHNYRTD